MKKCWEMEPNNRPTFSELCASITKYIERIAGYLEMGFNPFPGVGESETVAEEESEEDVCEPGGTLQVTSTPQVLNDSSEHTLC